MIKYNLKCQNDHEFESWFSSSEEFEKLSKRKLLECIYCSSKIITKSIMAPSVSLSKNNKMKKLNENILKEKKYPFLPHKLVSLNGMVGSLEMTVKTQ